MDKHTARGLAIGLFFTALFLIFFKPVFALDQENVSSYLEENDLIVISKEELASLKQSDNSAPKGNDPSEYESTENEKATGKDNIEEQQDLQENQEKEETKPEDQSFTISKGMLSANVAYELKKNGLIKHQGEFIKTLESKNGSKYIQIGEYKLNASMSNEEIISVITRNRVK